MEAERAARSADIQWEKADASKVANNLLKEEYAAQKRKLEEKEEEDGELTKELCKPDSFDYNKEAINSFTV